MVSEPLRGKQAGLSHLSRNGIDDLSEFVAIFGLQCYCADGFEGLVLRIRGAAGLSQES